MVKNISQIASELKKSQPHIWRIIHGQGNAGFDLAKKMSKIFGTDPILWIDPDRADERLSIYHEFKKAKEAA